MNKLTPYVYYPPGYNSIASDIIMYIACFIIIITCILLGWYFRMKAIEKLSDIWFKNKRMNHNRADKLHKEGRQDKIDDPPVKLTKRELNDIIIKKFMK